jgi:hypothetical protein
VSYSQEELQESGLGDFRVFLHQVWDFLDLPDPTPVQLSIAYWLQHGPRRMIIEAFRGVGKSWITVAFVLWNLLLDDQKKIEVVSASQPLADDFSKFCVQLIRGMEMLNHLEARSDQRSSALSYDVGPAAPSKDPSLKSAGITGQITGSRADIIVADDIEIPKNSFTHHLREKLSESVKEFDAVLKPNGRIIYLGTPQVEDTIYNKLEKRGYKARIWTAEIPERPIIYRGRLAKHVQNRIEKGIPAGTPIDPKRFDEVDLLERRASYGATGYALQFMLDTTPSEADRHPLKCSNLIIHDCDSEMAHVKMVWGSDKDVTLQDLQCGGFDGDYYVKPTWKSDEMTKYQGTVAFIDPSGGGKDETALAIVRYCQGQLYLVHVSGFEDGFGEETLEKIAMRFVRYGVNKYIVEKNYGGGMFNQLLKPVVIRVAQEANVGPAREDEEYNTWSTGNKEQRILDVLEPILGSHRLTVDRRVIEYDLKQQERESKYSFVHQMTRMARIKQALPHEDRLEAVAGACAYWTERMARDKSKAVEKHKEEALDAELRNFAQHVFGQRPRQHRYIKV